VRFTAFVLVFSLLLLWLALAAPVFGAGSGDPLAKAAAGDSLFAAGNLAGAEAAYREALEIAKSYQAGLPERVEGTCVANYGLARVALEKKQPKEAEKLLDDCKDKPKYEGKYLLGMGLVRFQEANYVEAEQLLVQGATRLDRAGTAPDAVRVEIAEKLVEVSEAKDEPLLAAQRLDDLARLNPKSAAPLVKKGKILVEMREYEEAREAFGAAIQADSTALEPYQEIATLYMRAKQPGKAAATLERAAMVKPSAESYLAAAAAWDSAGQAVKALPLYERAATLDPNSGPAKTGMARAAIRGGDPKRALEAFKAMDPAAITAEDRKLAGEAAFAVGHEFYRNQDFAAAIPYFEQTVAADSTAAGAYTNLGLCYLQTGRPDDGIRMLERAAALEPKGKTRVWLAQALASQSKWDRAVQEYKAVLATEPENHDALRGLGFCLLNQGRYNEAVENLAKASRLDPQNVQGFVWLGQGLALAERYGEAESAFRQALSIDPKSSDARSGLDQVLAVKKKS
jgi:tetratricopeptide (TPR) repeat protein